MILDVGTEERTVSNEIPFVHPMKLLLRRHHANTTYAFIVAQSEPVIVIQMRQDDHPTKLIKDRAARRCLVFPEMKAWSLFCCIYLCVLCFVLK